MSTKRSWARVMLLALAFGGGYAGMGACSNGGSGKPAAATPPPPVKDAGTNVDANAATPCSHSTLNASEVVLLGESFFALTRATPGFLSQRARDASAIGADQKFRDLSLVGAELSSGAILEQYRLAAQQSPVKVVVLNAGMYDLLLGGRCSGDDETRCAAVSASADALFTQLAADHVQDVIYVFYPDPTKLGTDIKPAMDALRPQLQKLCTDTQRVHCHWLDLRPVWDGHPEYSVDGLHPSTAGAQATANAIWDAMRASCVAP